MATTSSGVSEDLARAWEYYKHADSIQHSRHNVFMVAQSMMLAAFATIFVVGLPTPQVGWMLNTIVAAGVLLSALWFVQSQRLSDGMSALSREYLEVDPVYAKYLAGLRKDRASPPGRLSLNVFQPSIFTAIWFVSGFAHLAR